MRRWIWNIFCFFLWLTQALRLVRYFNRKNAIILCYGGITESKKKKYLWNSDGRYVTSKRFRRQVRYLEKHYVIKYASEIASSIEKFGIPPGKSVAITFDYGYKNTYLNALKPLTEYSIPFGFSIVTSFLQKSELIWYDRLELTISKSRSRVIKAKVGGYYIDENISTRRRKAKTYQILKIIGTTLDFQKREMFLKEIENQANYSVKEDHDIPDDCQNMNVSQMIEIANCGAELGSNSSNLVDLRNIPRQNLLDEIYESRNTLSRLSGKDCSFFILPLWYSGKKDETLQEIIEKSGYSFALTNVPSLIKNNTNPFLLPRITIYGYDNFFTFAAKLSGIGIKSNNI